jgi:hypothetical protein
LHRFVSFRLVPSLLCGLSLWSTVKIAATASTTQGNYYSLWQPSAVRHPPSAITAQHHDASTVSTHPPICPLVSGAGCVQHSPTAASHPGAAYDTASEPLQAGSSSVRRRVVQLGARHSRGGLYSSLCYCHGRPVLCTRCRFFARSLAFRLTLLALYLQHPILPVRDSSLRAHADPAVL